MASPNQQTIPTLSRPVFIPDASDFEGTVRQQLGDLGTGSDGFDATFAVPASNIDADLASLATFDVDVAAAEFHAGDFATVYHAPVDAELPGLLADGDKLNAIVQDPGAVNGAPVITPVPPPPSAGGSGGGGTGGSGTDPGAGGSGGGGGMGGGDQCEINDDMLPWCDGAGIGKE
jgi:hypothetical protein